MKKITAIVTALIVWISFSSISLADFPDVPPSHHYYDAINFVQSANIVSGYPDGSFKSGRLINRAEFTKIIIEAVSNEGNINACLMGKHILFDDTPGEEWFTPYICVARKENIIDGYPDGTFKPAGNINYAEAAKIIANGFQLDLGIEEQGEWYTPYTNALNDYNAKPPSITDFGQSITRGDMAYIIYRLKAEDDCFLDSFQVEVIDLTNEERAKEGLDPLSPNCDLQASSQFHSDDMQARDYFDHAGLNGSDPESRITNQGYLQPYFNCNNCSKSFTVGENIAKGQIDPAEVMESWMNSPEHRDNILDPNYSEIGIGYTEITEANGGNYIGYYWVQNFGDITLEQ